MSLNHVIRNNFFFGNKIHFIIMTAFKDCVYLSQKVTDQNDQCLSHFIKKNKRKNNFSALQTHLSVYTFQCFNHRFCICIKKMYTPQKPQKRSYLIWVICFGLHFILLFFLFSFNFHGIHSMTTGFFYISYSLFF